MASIQSFKGYGKVDEPEERAVRKQTRRRLIILTVSFVVLLAAIIGGVAGIVTHKRNSWSDSSPDSVPATKLIPSASLKALCSVTQYPNSCFSSISSIETSNTSDPEVLFKLSLHVAMNELSKFAQYPNELISKTKDASLQEALKVCQSVLEDSIDRLNDSISSMEVDKSEKILTSAKIDDIRTWLSTAITDQETCLDALEELNSTLVQNFTANMQNSTEFSSNSLAIATKILSLLGNFNIPIHRRLLSFNEFPEWVSPGDRRLLQDNSNATVHITVAQDGTGDFKTIKEAVDKVPKKSPTRFVIYVKEGTYKENVIMDKNKWNVMIHGDGRAKTIISGSLNFVDGTPTFSTATFEVNPMCHVKL